MSVVEKRVQERRRLLWVGLITYAVWCGALVLRMSPGFTPVTLHLLALIEGLFALPWAVSLVWLMVWLRRVKTEPQVFAALNDEMTVRIRWRAQSASRSVMLVSLVLGVVLCTYVDISAVVALLALIWILVISQIGFYLWFDRSE